MTAEQFERLKSELEASFQGTRNAGRPLLLEGGLDWKAMSLTPRDLDFMEAKHASAREIALAIGVPPMLLGIPGDNTYANYAEANRAFWRQTVLPLVSRTARALTLWLTPAYAGDLRFEPDLDKIEALAPEREALWKRLEATSFLTDAEKRAAIGYTANTEGGDTANRPFANKYNPYHDDRGRFDFAPGGATESEFVPSAGPRGRHPPHRAKPQKPDKPDKPATKTPNEDGPQAKPQSQSDPKPLNEILKPEGHQVGTRNSGASSEIRTVSKGEFEKLEANLLNGAKPTNTPSTYQGQWHERADGTIIGIRQSNSGPVIDVIRSSDPVLRPGYKVHQQ